MKKRLFSAIFFISLIFLPPFDPTKGQTDETIKPEVNQTEDLIGEYLPLIKVNPRYPEKALKDGMQGGALVEYTVGVDGKPKDIILIAEIPEGYGFGLATIMAAKNYIYQPRIKDGVPVEVKGVRTSTFFSIGEEIPKEVIQYLASFREPDLTNPEGNIYGLEPDGTTFNKEKYIPIHTPEFDYPRKAKKAQASGKVKLQFTVLADGTVTNVEVLEETPEGFGFAKIAKKMVTGSIYLPLEINGQRIEFRNVVRTIKFCGPPILIYKRGSTEFFQPAPCPHS